MKKQLDDMHFSPSKIDGTKKKKRIAISAREDGKTTRWEMKAYDLFTKEKKTTILFKRLIADISTLYIESLFAPFEKFREPVPFTYHKGDITNGVIPIYSLDNEMIFLIVCLAVPKARYKSLIVKSPGMFVFDEMIIDTRGGEKYLKGEVFRLEEAYKTFYREGSNVPLYMFGNPYSLHNPYFQAWGINGRELAEKRFLNPPNTDWCAEYRSLDPRLVADIMKRNPSYSFDDDYFKYAIEGRAINDKNIRIIEKQPQGFGLSVVFLYDGRFYGVYRSREYNRDLRYWIGEVDPAKVTARIVCFDFKDLVDGSVLFSRTDRERFSGLGIAMRNRRIAFQNLGCDYALEDIYRFL